MAGLVNIEFFISKMEEYLDNDVALAKKCTTEGHGDVEVQKKSVDDEGNDLLLGHDDTPGDVENLDNHKMTNSDNTDDFYDAEETPATLGNAGNEETSTDEEECCFSDIEPINVANIEDGLCEDSSVDLAEKPESWCASDVQTMEVCDAVNSIYGRADYICVSEDLVDGCAVATLCQIQGHADAIVCSRLSKNLTVHGDSEEDDEEYDGNFHRGESLSDDTAVIAGMGDESDEDEEESDGRCLQSPTLREISEEEDNACVTMDGLMESESLVLSRDVCLTRADYDTVGDRPDNEDFLLHPNDETAVAADADIEPNDVHADGATVDMHDDDIETIDQGNVDAINSLQDADLINCTSNSKVETVDHHTASTSSDPHFDHATEIASSHDSDMALALEVSSAKGPHPGTSALGFGSSSDSTLTSSGIAVDSSQNLHPPCKVSEHTAAKPPPAVKDILQSDSFKEPKEPVVLRSKKSKRVDSIRRSFIK